jgi:type IV secretion system protein TrbG
VLRYAVMLGLVLLVGCAHEEPAPPPVPPPPEDLSTWSVPELVQPPPVVEESPKPVSPEKPNPAEQVLDFTPGTTYTLTVGMTAPLDVVLGPGEQVRNIVGGDRTPAETQQTARWEVKEGADGLQETLRQHIFVSPIAPGMTTGFIVTTTHRTYYLTLKSVKSTPFRLVRWRYPLDVPKPKTPPEPGLLPDPAQPKHYHVGYELVGTTPSWNPRYVVDDGKKTYIIYPEVTLFETVPMLRLVGPNGPQLVNARQCLNVVIVDQLVPRAELRVGRGEHAEVVTITRGAMRTIACPGDEACPVWPQAAQKLAQRSPPVQPPWATQAVKESPRPSPPPPGPAAQKPTPHLEEAAQP